MYSKYKNLKNGEKLNICCVEEGSYIKEALNIDNIGNIWGSTDAIKEFDGLKFIWYLKTAEVES